MNDQTQEQPLEPEQEAGAESTAVAAPQPQFNDSRRRLRELLSVPERDRTDEQWDEIIELEIQLAPGNRIAPNERQGGGPGGNPGGHHGKPGGGGGGQKKNHRPRTGNNRRPRGPKPSGGGQAA